MSRLMTSHRSVSKSLKRDFAAHNHSGIEPFKNIRLAEVQCGGPQNLGCTPKDYRNFILKSRNFEMQKENAQSLLNFFREMQVKDREYYYSIDVDNRGRMQNVVWMYSHCKAAYEHFHDAICFDTAYLINCYNIPFASFIGINHQRQPILLGCALISHEDIFSYKLVFRTWLEAMGHCIWYIFSKLPLYLSGLPDSKIVQREFNP
ncbi:hypothetical protein BC332_25392 [Capsicum chinense]|nr:hypothetical protein BC332_25392 [Capsicum chinense]